MQPTLVVLWLAAGAQVRAQARLRGAASYAPLSFLVISSPERQLVEYMRLPDGPVRPLVDHGLSRPQGVAVNGTTLYVADPASKRVDAYELTVLANEHLAARKFRTVVSNVEAHSVAVGDKIYFTDEANKFVEEFDPAPAAPAVLFDGEDVAAVAAPGGLAINGLAGLLWTNTAQGSARGALVSADLVTKTVSVMAGNVESAYGVCVSNANIFYTAADTTLFGVKRTGGAPAEVSTLLIKPRGCVYDTDGTIYVADESAGKVYSLPANAETLGATDLTEVVTVAKPYGLAYVYYDPAAHARASLLTRFMHWWNTA